MGRNHIRIAVPLEDSDDFYQDWIKAKKQTAEAPNIIVDKRYDPNITFGEAMKKMIAPPNTAGMRPTWTQKTREKYRACIQPSLETYKLAVEKLNRAALEKYDDQSRSYRNTSLGIGTMNSISNVFLSDKEIKVRYSYRGTNFGTGGGTAAAISRGTLWATFIWNTTDYISVRLTTMERDYRDFEEQTEIFFKKVNQCRKENPYDSWVLKSLEEQYYDQTIFYRNYTYHPHRWLTLPME